MNKPALTKEILGMIDALEHGDFMRMDSAETYAQMLNIMLNAAIYGDTDAQWNSVIDFAWEVDEEAQAWFTRENNKAA